MYPYRHLLPLWAAILAGCAGIPADRGLADVEKLVSARGGPTVSVSDPAADSQAPVRDWLSRPLSAEQAVRVAMVRSPILASGYARLGIAQAEVYDAARLTNPILSASALATNEPGGTTQLGLGIAQNFAELLLYGPRNRIAEGELERTKAEVAAEIVGFAAALESAYFEHVGAVQVAQMRELVASAADVSARLAQRFFDAGNISRLELRRELAAASAARIELARAQAGAEETHARLNALMGLADDEAGWTAVARLPAPLAEEDDLAALQALARGQRLDLRAAQQEVALLEDALGVTRSYRYLGDFEVGVDYERDTDRSRLLGPTLSLQLPLLNSGAGSIERARARLRALEIEASNGVALAHRKVLLARGLLDRYRDEFIPQREEIVQRLQQLQSFMIVGQFELLLAKQEEYGAYQAYLETLRDYWVARTELAREVGSRLPSHARVREPSLDVETLTRPRAGHEGHSMEQMDHSGHGAHAPADDEPPPEPEPHEHHPLGDTP